MYRGKVEEQDFEERYHPMLVVCMSCGVVYDYTRANGLCPLCGSKDHRSLFLTISAGSPVFTLREGEGR